MSKIVRVIHTQGPSVDPIDRHLVDVCANIYARNEGGYMADIFIDQCRQMPVFGDDLSEVIEHATEIVVERANTWFGD